MSGPQNVGGPSVDPVLGPGKNLLVTLLASNAGTTCAISAVWDELPTNG